MSKKMITSTAIFTFHEDGIVEMRTNPDNFFWYVSALAKKKKDGPLKVFSKFDKALSWARIQL